METNDRKARLLPLWDSVTRDLKSARERLGLPPDELGNLDQFLAANELELALDELLALGQQTPCTTEYWARLLSAAQQMNLTDHAARITDLRQSATERSSG